MSQLFDKIKVANSKRSTFDLSHHQVTTSDFGYLLPICYRDMVPNDDFVVKPNIFCRLAPLAVPTYGRITCSVHHFFIPYRILYPKWDAFITQDKNNHTVPPYFTQSVLAQALNTDSMINPEVSDDRRGVYTRLMSNLGLNPYSVLNTQSDKFSAFPFLAYYRLWLDWFADTNIYDHPLLVEEFNNIIANGGNIYAASLQAVKFLELKYRCYKKDYLTTAKLNPQDGNPSLVGVDVADLNLNPKLTSNSGSISVNSSRNVWSSGSSSTGSTTKIGQFTIEALRAANSLQRYLERNNFVGTKLINRILAHFGVAPQPERLDMAEFIGGSSFPIQIGDVTSHTGTNGTTEGLGYQAGKAVGAGSGDSVRYHAKEHGIFMSVMSILPDTGYYQGISRFWHKGLNGDALDFYTPEFENLGYQEILNEEVYVPTDSDRYDHYDSAGIFGYSPRFSEYKFQSDVLGSDMLFMPEDDAPGGAPNDAWHLFRTLHYNDDNPLALNENFVECNNMNTDYDRIFQFTQKTFDHFYFNIDMDVKATRPMSGFGEPSLDSTNEGDGNTINLAYGGTRL